MSGLGTGLKNPRSPDQCVGVDAAVGILGVSIDVNPFVSGQGKAPMRAVRPENTRKRPGPQFLSQILSKH